MAAKSACFVIIIVAALAANCRRQMPVETDSNLAEVKVKGPDQSVIDYESMTLEIADDTGADPKIYSDESAFSGIRFEANTTVTMKLALLDANRQVLAQTMDILNSPCPPEERTLIAGPNTITLKICRKGPDGQVDVLPTGDANLDINVRVVEEAGPDD